MNPDTIQSWAEPARNIATILAIVIGAIWSWFQFRIGDLLKPNFIFSVEIVSVSNFQTAKFVILKVSVKNIGKVTIKHKSSQLQVIPIHRSEIEVPKSSSDKTIWEIEDFGQPKIFDEPFSPVYMEEGEKLPFVLRPSEEICVDVPVGINDLSIVALKVCSSFHTTSSEKVRGKKEPYGGQFQHIFDLTQLYTESSQEQNG